MARLVGGRDFEFKLKGVVAKLKTASRVSIGFPEGATYPDGTSVALVAAVNEFGAPSRGIPPRPFIRSMIAKHKDEWGDQTGAALKASGMDAKSALGLMGEMIAGEMRQSIMETNDPPNAPITIRRKGSAKPLVDTGQMLRSVAEWVE